MDNLLEKIKGSGAVLIDSLASAIESSLGRAGYENGLRQSLTVAVIKALCSMAGGRQFYLPAHWKLEDKFKHCETNGYFSSDEAPGLVEIYEIVLKSLAKTSLKQCKHHRTASVIVSGISFMAGGRVFYIPVSNFIERFYRDTEILREFTGKNIHDLARKYRLSETAIRNILKSKPGQKNPNSRQAP